MMKTQQSNNMPDRSRPGSTMRAHPTVRLQSGCGKCATGAKTAIGLSTIGTRNVRPLHACENLQKLGRHWRLPALCRDSRKIWHWRDKRRRIETLEFAKSHRLTLANTCLTHKLPRTATWNASNGQVYNKIDNVLTPQRFKSSINKANTRSFPGVHIGSDHELVPTTIRLKLKTKHFTKSPRIRFDLEKLKDQKTRSSGNSGNVPGG